MARSGINKVILLGNLGADPELRTTAGGDAVATISIATSDSWKDKNTGEEQQKTEWHRVVFFRRMAEVVGQYLKKGSSVYIEGQLQTNSYEDKNTGEKKFSTQIVARDMQMLEVETAAKRNQTLQKKLQWIKLPWMMKFLFS